MANDSFIVLSYRCPLLVQTVLDILEPLEGKWSGTASELYHLVVRNWPADTQKEERQCPGGPNILTNRLRQMEEGMAKIGIRTSFLRNKKTRLIEIDAPEKAEPVESVGEEDTEVMQVADEHFQVQPLDGGKFEVALDRGFVTELPPHRKNRLSRFFDPATDRYAVVATWDGAIPYAKNWVISYLNGYKTQQAEPLN